MSIGVLAISEGPLAMQVDVQSDAKKPPRRRQIVAKADAIAQPEAR